MKILHISDTHMMHDGLLLPNLNEIDVIVHSGDGADSSNAAFNANEMLNFIKWYGDIDHPNKIYVAGNHDTSIEAGLITPDDFYKAGITYLQDDFTIINGVKFYGSPWTPRYGNWAFMKQRGKLQPIWNQIHDDVDILITHGPPYGFQDLSYNFSGEIDICGCKELRNRVNELFRLTHVLYGHIHNNSDLINVGIKISDDVCYVNSTAVTDGKFSKGITYHGTIFEV